MPGSREDYERKIRDRKLAAEMKTVPAVPFGVPVTIHYLDDESTLTVIIIDPSLLPKSLLPPDNNTQEISPKTRVAKAIFGKTLGQVAEIEEGIKGEIPRTRKIKIIRIGGEELKEESPRTKIRP